MPPLSIMIKPVSGLCNMRCTYCFYSDELARREGACFSPMNDTTMHQLLRRAFIYAEGSVTFAFQGGEPTLVGADFYRRWLRAEKLYNTRGCQVSHAMQSNGLLVDDEILSILRDGDFLLGISLDGTKEIHNARRLDAQDLGTYDRVMMSLRKLKDHDIPCNILCVVDQQVALHPTQVFAELKQYGYLQFIPRIDGMDAPPSEDSLDAETYGDFLCELFDLYERGFLEDRFVSVRLFDNWLNMLAGHPPEACGMAGRCARNFLIESNGNVYPCDFYATDDWLMGNINRDSFFSLEKSPLMNSFLESSRPVDSTCMTCPWRHLCRGGCRRDREPFTDSLPGLNRLCQAYRIFFTHAYERMKELAQLSPPRPPAQSAGLHP